MRIVRCFDPLHATRAGQPGFADELGRRPLPDGPDVVIDGLFCGACGKAFLDSKITSTEAERTARELALAKLLTSTGLTRAELRRILSASGQDI